MDDLSCKQIGSMITLYIDGKLNDEHRLLLEKHFAQCPTCYQKYLNMKNIIQNLKGSYTKLIKETEKVETASLFNIREYEKFHNNISAYIDNELDYDESIEFRKYLLKSKSARNDLKHTYIMQNHIKDSFSNFTIENNINLSKKVINQVKQEKLPKSKPYIKVAVIFGFLIFAGAGLFIFIQDHKDIDPTIKKQKKPLYASVIDYKYFSSKLFNTF